MDDASARSLLGNMQARLSRDPYDALGLSGAPSVEQIRSAFLQLTKQFHPAKFARLSTDVQKLANEVFLALRGAHDTLAKPSVTPRPTTAQIPVLRSPMPARPSSPPPNVTSSGTGSRPAVSAHAPTQQVPTTHAPTQPVQVMRSPSGPSAPIRPTPSVPSSRPPLAPSSPAQPMRAAPRAGTGVPDDPARSRLAQPSAPPAQPATPAVNPANRAAVRPGAPAPAAPRTATRPTSPPPTAAPNTDPELTSILELIDLGQITSARMLLEKLVGRIPSVPRYKALLHFAKGKEALMNQRPDEARVELNEALQIVPDLQLAKTALVEMMTRRK